MRLIALVISCFLMHESVVASCCSTAGSGNIGRLLPHERALVMMSTSTRMSFGLFDDRARLVHKDVTDKAYLVVEPELHMMARVADFFQPFLTLPVRIQKSQTSIGADLADISFGARIFALREYIINKFSPALTVLVSARAPTGIATLDGIYARNSVDITGSGTWLYTLGAVLEKNFAPLTYSLGYSFAVEADYFSSAITIPAATHMPNFGLSLSVPEIGQLSLSVAMLLQAAPVVNHHKIKDSDRRKLTVGVSYSKAIHSHMQVNAQIGSDVPIDYVGKNINHEIFLKIGMRFGVF